MLASKATEEAIGHDSIFGLQLQPTDNKYFRITEVSSDLASRNDKITVGDIIIKINGLDISKLSLEAGLERIRNSGDTITLEIQQTKDGQIKTVELSKK